ncbi:hypothetical protein HMPREF0185_00196 [Brevundimonas diminuta 470-4]|nr:hypothetical protein HMPREF0185_00196 [Brevundimonas diminuta 470-4]
MIRSFLRCRRPGMFRLRSRPRSLGDDPSPLNVIIEDAFAGLKSVLSSPECRGFGRRHHVIGSPLRLATDDRRELVPDERHGA